MGIVAVLQLILGLEPLITKGIADIRVAVTGGAPGSETYEVYVTQKKAVIAADKTEIASDKELDDAVISQ